MGAFFTNVHVHTGGRPSGEVHTRIVETLRRWVLSGPFTEVEQGAEADRTILVGPAGPAPWIAVYDELTETQDTVLLEELAGQLSAGIGGVAVGVLVHDSDVLSLSLHRDGSKVDAYSSAPDHLGEVDPKVLEQLCGRPPLWRDVLTTGASPEDLRVAWSTEAAFAEEILERTAHLLGMKKQYCLTGFNYLSAEAPDPRAYTRLAFRSTRPTRPAQAAQGPPVLELAGHPGIEVRVDSTAGLGHLLYYAARNKGGAACGLEVIVWGEAIDEHVIVPTAVRAAVGGRRFEALFTRRVEGGSVSYTAELHDLELPAGTLPTAPDEATKLLVLEMLQALAKEDPKAQEALRKLPTDVVPSSVSPAERALAMHRFLRESLDLALISVWIQGRVAGPGEGGVSVRLVPTANPEQGKVTFSTRMRIS